MDKGIETIRYEIVSTRKDLKKMTLLAQTNSTTIADILGLIREQNKSLTDLRRDVESLKSELGVVKKGNHKDVIVEAKTEEPEEIR
jgi:hypothetical protein